MFQDSNYTHCPEQGNSENRAATKVGKHPQVANNYKQTEGLGFCWVFFFGGGQQILDSGKLYNLVNTEYSFLKGAVSSHVTLQFSFDIFFFFDLYCGANSQRAEVRGQLEGGGFLLWPHRSWGSNSGHQAWWHPHQLSHDPSTAAQLKTKTQGHQQIGLTLKKILTTRRGQCSDRT